eukprot:scaffold42585_cov34-Attheya_sp.AAC.1
MKIVWNETVSVTVPAHWGRHPRRTGSVNLSPIPIKTSELPQLSARLLPSSCMDYNGNDTEQSDG